MPATRTGPLYNAVSYPTKISPESVGLFIACHTKPGDTVLDVFAGSGSTGLGALLCDRPTARMEELAAEIGVVPEWGPRDVVLYELGEFASLISRVMCSPPEPSEFRAAAEALISDAESAVGWMYSATSPDGDEGRVRHVIWTDILICGQCGAQTTYWTAAVRRDPLRLVREFCCRECGSDLEVDQCQRRVEHYDDSLIGTRASRRARVPAWVYGQSGSRKWAREATLADTGVADRAAHEPTPASAPLAALQWGDLHRSGYHFGMTHLHHLYTPRNFAVMAALWDRTQTAPAHLQDALRLLLLSYNASHATLMTRVVVKDGSGDFVITGAQSGVLYVPGLPVEKNVITGVRRKIATLDRAFATVIGSKTRVRVVTASSTSLDLSDQSVDYLFTDPPFGANIPYAEVNQVNELWLRRVTARDQEVVISPNQGKGVAQYRQLLAEVFHEVARVLRPDASGTVVFHSAHSEVWGALTGALTEAGLIIKDANVLDKVQPSFKQTVSATAVKGDPLILVTKSPTDAPESTSPDELFLRVLAEAESSGEAIEAAPARLYSRFIGECLRLGVPVPWSASKFYAAVDRERIA